MAWSLLFFIKVNSTRIINIVSIIMLTGVVFTCVSVGGCAMLFDSGCIDNFIPLSMVRGTGVLSKDPWAPELLFTILLAVLTASSADRWIEDKR